MRKSIIYSLEFLVNSKCPEALVLKLLIGGTATKRQHFFMIYSGNSAEEKENEVAQSCLTLCNDCSLPGSSVHGIFQARILEWVAISKQSFKCLDVSRR